MAFVYTVEKVEKLLSDGVHSGYSVIVKCTDNVTEKSTSCVVSFDSTEVTDRTLKTKIQAKLAYMKDGVEASLRARPAPTFTREEHDTLVDAVLTV